MDYQTHLEEGYIYCRMQRIGHIDEVLQYIGNLFADESLNKPFYEIVDFSDSEIVDFGYYDLNRMQPEYIALSEIKPYLGSIFVVKNDYSKGLANMFKSVGDFRGVEIHVVDSLKAAKKLAGKLIKRNSD